MNSFICGHCKKEITTSGYIGTHQRNHCPFCLYSKHVDEEKGDRKAICHGMMLPVGLTFKKEGEGKVGELMLVHQCEHCGKISINRLAGDDGAEEIMQTFEMTLALTHETKELMKENGIELIKEQDREEVRTQLFGK